MAVSALVASVIVRNSTIEARFAGGVTAFARSCPNQTFCTDGTLCRVGFMTSTDAEAFILQMVAAGIVPSIEDAPAEIALVIQGKGFTQPCDWLQLGLFDGRPCAWEANTDRGNLFLPEVDMDPHIVRIGPQELRESFELVGLKDGGKIEVYRHRKTGELRYVGRPFQSVRRKWWEFWKKPDELVVNEQNYDQTLEAAWDLVKPYVTYQLTQVPLEQAEQKQLRRACEMFTRTLQFNPGNWVAFWGIGLANKCLRNLEAAYAAFQSAYRLEKTNPNVARELAGVCIALGKGEEAVRVSREVSEKYPDDSGLISNHAFALLIAGQVEDAERAVERALELDPQDQITLALAEFINNVRENRVARPHRWP